MKNIEISHITLLLSLSLFINGCVEPIVIDYQSSFIDAIVIEATITNEFKHQQIKITRTFEFEQDGPKAERNTIVKIVDSSNNTFVFTESEPGIYLSNTKFEAKQNIDYQLFITTETNRSYTTLNKQLTNPTQIDNLYASTETNSLGNEIMSIFVDSFDPNRNSNYYRYEYEETYKIVAPYWTNIDFIILQDEEGRNLPDPGFIGRSIDERVCYNTIPSNSIIQTSTMGLSEDKVLKFAVHNISIDNAIISHRYSILVKQYVQSLEAFTYYDMLNQLSGSGSLFSQIQTGFINSNIFSTENREEKVLGFFEVSSVSSKRVFFNYRDFFPNEALPPYFTDCMLRALPITADGGKAPLMETILAGTIKFYTDNTNPKSGEGPYLHVPTSCGDCTVLGNSVKPDFWIE